MLASVTQGLGDEWCGDVVHDIWLHSVGMWPAAQCQAASAAALVSTCQTPIVAQNDEFTILDGLLACQCFFTRTRQDARALAPRVLEV